jgi:hypothetical protein
MWDPQPPGTLRASTACYRDYLYLYLFDVGACSISEELTASVSRAGDVGLFNNAISLEMM